MKVSKMRLFLPLAGLILAAAYAGSCEAATSVVTVSLSDKGASADMATDLGMATGDTDMSKSTMQVSSAPATVKAGEVTFEVTNNSKETIHEMLVSPVRDMHTPLPFVADENRVDEDAAGHLGEVSELEPGKSGALRLDLKAGKYILFCNIPGHYMNGMWTILTVE